MHHPDHGRLSESAHVAAALGVHEPIAWRVKWKVDKYLGSDTGPDAVPYETIEREGNILVFGGSSALLHRLIGGTTVTAFDNANAYIGVGDGTTAADAAQTDLQGASKTRKGMDATYPQHTDGTVTGSQTATFRATFGQSDANHDWKEWGLFNAAAAGRMLNRRVEDLGVKSAAASWVFTVTASLQ